MHVSTSVLVRSRTKKFGTNSQIMQLTMPFIYGGMTVKQPGGLIRHLEKSIGHEHHLRHLHRQLQPALSQKMIKCLALMSGINGLIYDYSLLSHNNFYNYVYNC